MEISVKLENDLKIMEIQKKFLKSSESWEFCESREISWNSLKPTKSGSFYCKNYKILLN